MNYKTYFTIENLIECGIATEKELIKSYANYLYKNNKEIHEPKYTKDISGIPHTFTDISSKDYRFYAEVDRLVYRMNIGK